MSQESTKTKTTNELASERTNLSAGRTRWSADRTLWADDCTLAAWIRTSLALIGFGIGVGGELEYLEKFGRVTDPYQIGQNFWLQFHLSRSRIENMNGLKQTLR